MYNARSPNNVQQDVINSVYIRFVTPRTERLITEEDLHRVFDHFGHIIDVSIKDSTIDPVILFIYLYFLPFLNFILYY